MEVKITQGATDVTETVDVLIYQYHFFSEPVCGIVPQISMMKVDHKLC